MDREKPLILIVDDNTDNLGVLFEGLQDAGYELRMAENGVEAIRMAEYLVPDLILLDIIMPGMDGFETCRYLKESELTRDIPVIFMTALTESVDEVMGLTLGAVDYIRKPCKYEIVKSRINTHLTLCRQKKELAELNRQLSETNIRLAEANEAKNKFFSIIAHDTKNAIIALLSATNLLSKSINDLSQEKILMISSTMHTYVNNLYNLLDNLLNWARSQSGKIAFNPQKINIKKLINRNIDLLQENAKQKEIKISCLVNPVITAYGDRNMVDIIIRNLVSNAIKYTMKFGEVTISAVTSDNFVEIAVSDTGIGIKEENMEKLFRIDNQYKKEGTAGEFGTGLGLILCCEFVEKNNGHIWVESEFGKGTTFRFTLPLNTDGIA